MSAFDNVVAAGLRAIRSVAGNKVSYHWKDGTEQSVDITGAVMGHTDHVVTDGPGKSKIRMRSTDWLIACDQLEERGEPAEFDQIRVKRPSGVVEVYSVKKFGKDRTEWRWSDRATQTQFRIHTDRSGVV